MKYTDSGSYADYFVKGKFGFKVLNDEYQTKLDAQYSETFDTAMEEYFLLCYAQASKVVPKVYGVKIIKLDGVWRVAIKMQHLGNKTLYSIKSMKYKEKQKIQRSLLCALEDKGIIPYDLHFNNILKYKRKYYAIDFTPHHVEVMSQGL